jgi:hypothetical protein
MKFLIVSLFILLQTSNNTLNSEKTNRKLAFLFKRNDFYCPKNHKKSSLEDFCFLISKYRLSYSQAKKNCKKVSQRLVHIDNSTIFEALKFTVDNYFLHRNLTLNQTNFAYQFYLASTIKTLFAKEKSTSNLFETSKKNLTLNSQYFCEKDFKAANKTLLENDDDNCIELNYTYIKLTNSSHFCLNFINCKQNRNFICEWRGHTLENFSKKLRNQIKISFIITIFVLLAFCFLWFLLYSCHDFRVKDEISLPLSSYLKQNELFSFNFKNVDD